MMIQYFYRRTRQPTHTSSLDIPAPRLLGCTVRRQTVESSLVGEQMPLRQDGRQAVSREGKTPRKGRGRGRSGGRVWGWGGEGVGREGRGGEGRRGGSRVGITCRGGGGGGESVGKGQGATGGWGDVGGGGEGGRVERGKGAEGGRGMGAQNNYYFDV